MSTGTIILIVVLVLVVLGLMALGAAMSRRRRHQRHHAQAEQLRDQAAAGAAGVDRSQTRAQEADVRAQEARREAERAEQEAARAHTGAAQHEAAVEDRVREADRVDPQVDHRSEGYRPESPGATEHHAASTGPVDEHGRPIDEGEPGTHPAT